MEKPILKIKEITEKYSNNNLLKIQGQQYKLIGLPLFNQKNNDEFNNEYDKII